MKGEATLVAKDIEGLTAGVLGGGDIVLALIKERSGFLTFESFVSELDGVHGERAGGLFAVKKAGGARRKAFEFPDARVDTFDDGGGAQTTG
jgi:hypothetical protein